MGLPFSWGSSFWSGDELSVELEDLAGYQHSDVLRVPNAGTDHYGFRMVSPVPANAIKNR